VAATAGRGLLARHAALRVRDDLEAGLGYRLPAVDADSVLPALGGLGQPEEALLLLAQPQVGLQVTLARLGIGGRLGRVMMGVAGLPAIGGEVVGPGALMSLAREPREPLGLILRLSHGRDSSAGMHPGIAPVGCRS